MKDDMIDELLYIVVLIGIFLFFAKYIVAFIILIVGIAILFSLFCTVKNYILAIKENMNFKHWKWKKGDEPARRSYFFGPGYKQLAETIKDTFDANVDTAYDIRVFGDKIRGRSTGKWGYCRAIARVIFIVLGYVTVYGAGTALCALLLLIHGAITTLFMLLSYVIFSIVWITDRIYLIINKIRSDCPDCHSRFLIPTFMCPDCGAMHKKLVPGPYGIWKHKCTCGKTIPSTFLNGRSKVEAFCPDCGHPLVASDARPVVFQLIGGSKAGKTVYLSAFFHEYLQKLNSNRKLSFTIKKEYKPYFDELEKWHKGIACPATAQHNAQMYPVLIESSLGVKRQLSIYDISGEMFDGATADFEIQQQQFHYCDGFLFLIDPFSSGDLRMKKIKAHENMSDFSDMAVEDVATNFINYLIRTGHAKANSRCSIPVAVLIAKADIREVKQVIDPNKIRSIFLNNTEQYSTYENARDSICRQFLMDIGLSATVNNLETQFSNLHYFPVSAMGHSSDGTSYKSWGTVDPVKWMLPLADKELADLIYPQQLSIE